MSSVSGTKSVNDSSRDSITPTLKNVIEWLKATADEAVPSYMDEAAHRTRMHTFVDNPFPFEFLLNKNKTPSKRDVSIFVLQIRV